MIKNIISTFCLFVFLTNSISAKEVNILDYGADPTQKELSTNAIQKAIDVCLAKIL